MIESDLETGWATYARPFAKVYRLYFGKESVPGVWQTASASLASYPPNSCQIAAPSFLCLWAGSFFGALYGGMVGQKFFQDPGSMWVGGPSPFLPASERCESGVEIILR
jgi:hypothetical protein